MLSRDRRLPDWLRFRLWADAGSKDAALKRAKPGRWRRWRIPSIAALSLAAVLLAAFAALPPLQTQAQAVTPTTFVSNTAQIPEADAADNILAQSFRTGANTDGYTVSDVHIRLAETVDKNTQVRIRKNNSGEPAMGNGDLVATLTNPSGLTENSLNTFTAPADTTLDPNTRYWITVNERINQTNRSSFVKTSGNGESGTTGWSIDNDLLFRATAREAWGTASTPLLITIRGTTGTTNNAPVFEEGTSITRGFKEDIVPGSAFGGNVKAATDADGDTLTYTLEGGDAAQFEMNSNRRLRTKAEENYSYERRSTYYLKIKADDNNGGIATIDVTVNVGDVEEQPDKMARPLVWAPDNTSGRMELDWTEPGLGGGPDITKYLIELNGGGIDDFIFYVQPHPTAYGITNLLPGTKYEIRMRARNGEIDGAWSDTEKIRTNPSNDQVNDPPTFNEGNSPSRTLNETHGDTTVFFQSTIGAAVTATDPERDTISWYSLEGTDVAKFGFDTTNGQIKTKIGQKYDYESKPSYSVTVKARDDRGGVGTIDVTLRVNDNNFEAPLAPSEPTVTGTLGSTTSLDVSWTAPTNTGRPDIDTYNLRYRVGNNGSWTDGPQDVTGTSATIGNLASDTSYRVEVQAISHEGNSGWSPRGDGQTNAQTADASLSGLALADNDGNAISLSPVFASGVTAYDALAAYTVSRITVTPTRSAADAAIGYLDGDDNALTDADTDADADGFQVNLTSGENTIKVQVTSGDGSTTQTYTVTVTRQTLTTFVSNTGRNAQPNGPINRGAQSFVTGASAGGFTISEVEIRLLSGGGSNTRVTIREDNGSGEPATGDPVATLTNPATLTVGLKTFTAPPGTTLAPEKTYWISVNEVGGVALAITASDNETGETGWSIGDTRLSINSATGNWRTESTSLMIEVRGTIGGYTASTDATLSDLALTDGGNAITLTPGFASDEYEYEYDASMESTVSRITVTPTPSDANASITYLDGDDNVLTDAEMATDGQQVDLTAGENTIKVKVTAEDTTTTLTYTVTVTQEEDPLVSNTGESLSGSGTNSLVAQSFETGASVGGFTISEVQLRLVSVTDKSTSVRIREDDSGEPATGAPLATLTNPATLTANSLNTFTAPADTTLAASTTYWITTNEGIPSADRASFQATNEDAETGETGWSIGDGRLYRSGETDSWTTQLSSLLIAIRGTTGGYVASTDATLKTLALEGATGGETIDLSPAFDAGTGTYTASVVNRIDSVKLTATKNDSNATVVITDDDDTGTPEEAELDLIVGSNTLTVTVTAEDGTPQTYTITVTRDAAPPVPTDCPADTDWCTTMTVGYVRSASSQPIIESFGYRADANFGDLGSTMFSHGGTPYSVTGIYRLKVSSLDGNPVNTDKLNLTVSPALPDGTIYQVGSRTFAVGTDSATSTAGQEQWDLRDNPPSWTAAQHVTVSLKLLDPGVTVSPTALTVTEEDTTGDSYTVVLDSQPTADVEVMVAGYSGTAVTPTPSTLTFTSVNWDMSQTVTVKAGADTDTENDTVTLTHSAASTDSDYDGSSITIASVTVTVNDDDEDAPAAGICGRTEEVRDALVELIPGVSDCAAVTDADLAAITGPLDLSSQNITALAAGDFAGLTALTELDLNNNGLTGLTADVFAGLTALEILYLHNNGPTELTADLFARLTALEQLNLEYNQLTTLPVGVFAGLTMLEQLNLENNQLTTLPVGVFEGLSSLDILGLDNNELNTLPAGVFDGLSSLRSLSLHDNQLNTLPVGVFDGLTALTLLHLRDNKLNRLPGRVFEPLISLVELWLVDNPGVPFAPTADALPDDGTVSNAGGTVTLDGSGSDGGPWGTNVTYAWALTTPTSGVTFDDATSATPEVTIQAPTAGAELIFTLTVTGRGDRASGTAVATDTATVTVNSPATGAPTISGTAEVGKMLTAGISAIMDADGVPGSLTYQWVRVDSDGSNTAEISGATSNTYLLVAADVGKRLKVKVSFTDNAGNSESLTSDAYPSSGTIVPETANTAPTFDEGGSTTRTFNETIGDATVGTASDIGTPVSATDLDSGDTLEYRLEGTDRTKFGINATSGQIRTKVGEKYDYEARTSYSVTVTVNDGTVTVSSAVTINVTDQNEPPPVMNKPVVTATANSTTSLEVSWTAPTNTGRPDIESYDLQYRAGNTGDFSNGPQNETGSSAAIGNLTADTEYQVRVRATNAEGDGVWSPSGTGTTGRTTITTDPPGVTVSETALTVTEEDTAGESYRVVLDSQPTAEVVVTVAGHAGTEVTPSPTSLTFTRSNWDTAQTVTVTAGSDADTVNDTVTLTHGAASADSNYDGNSITIASVTVTVNDNDEDTPAAGICGRTEQVRDALLAQIPGGSDCAAVTAADLAAITDTLNLSGQNISALAAGDFAGLTGLTELYLNNNGLTTLPKDVFAGLTALKVLTLYYNELTTLPDGVFGQLTSLNFLYLGDNPRAPFAPTAVARPDAGTVLVAGGTVTLDGSGSGGPWGTNVTYRWALTTPASGVRVTFDDSTSATPEVTIPTLAAGTELTFTLTVTGRGGTDGIETATDTARVTATQNITNNPPVFAGGAVQARTFDETIGDTAVTSASDIGTPVSATDPDTGDTLEYSLLGADRAKFTFDTSSGQIKTRAGESYDYEARTSYSVRVAVIDGTVTVSSAVTINVTDQDEPPPVMNKPVVTATANSTTSLEVSWTAPSNPGRPRIGSYDLQYRVGSNGGFSNGPQNETGSSAAIGNLTADTEYQVRVRATNAEGDGVWSPSGTGTTGRTTITTDPPGVTVSETALTVTEEDTAGDSYRVVLDSQPTAEVVVTVAGHAGTEVTPSPTSLTFTRSNWETGQTVTVTAGSDADTVNDTVTLTHSAASADSDYDGNSITIASVTVTVTDDDIDNAAPTFNEGGSPSRTFNETVGDETVGTASDIGTPVSATDPDTGDTLEYSLEGTDRTKFGINATSGQIRTKVGENYDYEARTSYSVRVAVNDGTVTVSSTVTINVTDQDEPPPVMNQPVVTATANSTTSLEVSWTEPSNPGRPDIESYDLQYRAGSTGDFSNGPQDQTGSSAAIGNLTADTSYEVRVRATNAEGDGVWSPSGTGTTGRTTITTDPPGVTVSPTALTVTEEDTAGDSYRVVLDSQPTAEVVVTVAGHAGTEVTPSPTSLTFTRSNWDTAQTVTVTAGSDADTVNDTVTLTHGAASADSDYDGNSITIASVAVTVNDDDIDTTAGICGRTEQVRDALLAQIPGGSDCAAVTAADLAAITDTLNLSGQNISALAAGDFAGLTGLTELYLNNNGLTTLPKDVFAGLTALKVLTLYYNELTTLPDGVFGQLTSLNFLYLGDNPRAPFAPTAVARPDAGTVLVAGGTVTLDGSGSGGPWGTNVTYRWALTTPASGVRVTFDDSTSATPEVTIPTLAAGTELTFTLTVTGRGGTDGIETATDTARVTATQNITNNPPVFAGGAVQARTFDETIGDTAVTSASDIGTPVSATDPDTGDTLEYSLLGADRAKFTFDTSSGQIKTRAGESYDYEARTSYSVRVAVIDGTVTVSSAVTINVTDQDEPPPVMNKPVVTATANSTTSLEVSWTAPSNPGRPRIGSYDLQYRVGSNGGFSNGPQNETGSSAAIGNLTADTEYQVRVRATNAEGDGVWSPSGTGTTGRTTITTDPPGVTVSETALTVTEEDTAGDSYRVVLDSQPTAEVVVTVAGHAGTEVTPSPTSLTFTRSNWETGQTVTVTAGSDADTVNDTVTLTHSAASADSDYDGNSITIASVTVTVTDDDIDNAAPTFNEGGSPSRTFNETVGDETVGTASDIGTPVSATDPDTGDTLEYSLEGTDRTKFGINATSGQIRTKVGENYDYEARTSYSVRVAVNDGTVTVSSTVTINVTDQDEPPPVMNQPVVTATANSTTSLEVSWTEPSNPGRPDIESYDLQYRAGSTGDFSNGPQDQTGSSAAIGNLTADTSYEVRVRATNAEGDGVWSPSGTGTTGRTTITTDPPGVTVSPTALTVTEEDTAGDSYRVVLDSQPTAEVVVTVAGHAGTEVTPSPTSLTFTRSNWDTAQTVTVTAGSDADTVNDTVTLTHGAASADSDYDGNSITIASVAVTVNDDDIDTTAGICGRTEQVRDALLAQIPGGSDCAAVTAADLAAITDTLNLSGQNISALAAGDFAGLTGLTELYLNNNGLTTLPKDVFAGLTALKVLTLYYNELTTLPDGVFGQLTSLNFLYLGDNPRAPFAPTAVARPDAGTVLVAGGTVTLDGSGSGGPWGTNVTYRWALTTPASGVRVTFDDSTSATPEVTIPTLAAGTELTFTLTVTGRGGTDGIETATDTARVTATQNITNNPPVFAGGAVQARTFDETIGDTAVTSASDIGTPVSATDPDTGDTLEYSLLGADRAKFTFDTSSGQIKTRAGESYDYEARTSYSVRVAVIDGTVTVSSAVTINVTDQDEPPPVMNKPVVTATANSTTSLEVSWTEPPNPGRPRIDSYDLQYRAGSNGDFSNGPQNETGSSAAIGNLTADTEYQVRVRATNAEGDGVWSPSGTGTTGRTTITTDPPGVTVSETALTVTEEDTAGDSYRVVLDSQPTAEVVVTVAGHAGTEVTPSPTSLTFTRSNWETGQTVTVTAGSDADTVNDTVTLTHSAASADSDYDGNSITIASVTVTVTDDDIDNAAPTFNEGGSPSRTFNETVGDETVGTASDIGTPVSATDPDSGDTLEYSLEGTDRTKFGINATSGQIRTKVGENYDYEARTSYSVRVAVNDGTVTVSSTVTINVTDQDEPPPVMNQPVVTATANSTTSLEVSWTEPSNPGRPDIESYDLQYRAGSTGDFSNGPQDQTGSSAAIGNLTADTSYEVRVRATNAEGDGVWSPSGTGTTGRTTITTDPPGVTVSPTALTVTEEDTAGDSYRVVLDSQPTAEVVVTVAGHAGTEVTPSPTSLTFTRSNWDTAQTVTVTAGSDADTVNDTVTLTHGAASADSDYDGNSITIASVAVTVNDDDIDTTAGICGRTEEVRDALLAQIPGGSDCAAVTAADLAAITGPLDLSGQNITALAAGDFAGLTGLIELYLNNNKLTTLRGDVFAGLTVLTQLQLNNNELETLPKDVFAGLPVLKLLTLYDNELGKLPDGVFEPLTALAYLGLYGNPGAPFAPTAVARPDAGTVLVAGGTVTLDGSGSGGPWGTNVTYRWALTTPASGVRVTFDDSTSATPEATIPTLAAGTELTFTLTVTGPGGTQGTAPGTDTATVTATDSVTASGDVTLGPLRVNDGTGEQTLAPAFASGTFASMRRRWATRSRRSR